MSLCVSLNRFKVLNIKNEKFARMEFRGITKFSTTFSDHDEIVLLNERFTWRVAGALSAGEVMTMHLMERTLWGTSRSIGVYRLGMHMLATEGRLAVTDTLVDNQNRPVPVFVEMDVLYTRPRMPEPRRSRESAASAIEYVPVHSAAAAGGSAICPGLGTLGSAHGSIQSLPNDAAGSAIDSDQSSAAYSDVDDDSNVELNNIGRNIANVERSLINERNELKLEMESEDKRPLLPERKKHRNEASGGKSREARGSRETGLQRLTMASKRLLTRGFSMSAASRKVVNLSERDHKQSAFKSMRNLMRLGRKSRGSDEERGLQEEAGGAGWSRRGGAPAPDAGPQPGGSAAELLVDTRSPPETPLKKKKAGLESTIPAALKAADFQVCVTVIEARQLAGLNMDPVVCVQVGDAKKYTSVKESTNCPYYSEYFVFDFHMPPIMLFDKIITVSVLQSRNILRANKLLGSFKLDVATVWSQPDRQFYHKWALLTDPDDVAAGAKGYLKCDISVIGKGDSVKIPQKSEKDEDDIEANLLLPDGVPIERQRARFIVKVHRADGLPKMNYSILANVKRALTGGESSDLVDPYVEVSFAGMKGSTSTKKNCYAPVWNEQLSFAEMLPPLCQRIKVQLRDNHAVHPNIIGTHFIDLKTISNDGERGFLPTFGPAFIHLYGSTRDYSLMDQHTGLNTGIGEGVSYRARVLISIRTEILDSIEYPISEVEVEPTPPIDEATFNKNEEFFLFASVFEANMIDKRMSDKQLTFELSIGNAGNSLDGHNESMRSAMDMERQDLENVSVDTGYWQSTTKPSKAVSNDAQYYYLPYWDFKQCMHIRGVWPDHRQRMYNSNLIAGIVDKFEEGLADTQSAIDDGEVNSDTISIFVFKSALDEASVACNNYAKLMSASPPLGNTNLDHERQKMCLYEIEQLGLMTRNLRALITHHSIKDRLRTAYLYLNRLKQLCEDPQHTLPDIFIWLLSNGKRLAYQRISARDIIFSERSEESGKLCGKMQTLFLKWPGKKSSGPGSWGVPAKINIYFWLGALQDKKHYIDGLPHGYEVTSELRNAEMLRVDAPATIFYKTQHIFQLRAYIYQARSLIGSDTSGLSDPFAKVIIGDCTATTQVIDETLSPTWDELLICDQVKEFGTMEQIKAEPPTVVIEIFDQDKVGKSEFIGRTLARPHIKAFHEPYEEPLFPPRLQWFEIRRGDDPAGELLAMFELLEIPRLQDVAYLPQLPEPREDNGKAPIDVDKGPILPVPIGIRPTLSKYRIEVLFWGLRDLKRIHLLTVDKPRVDIECAGHVIYSTVIQNSKRNPNFMNPVKFIDVYLPDQDLYRPPLSIRVMDCRSFGRMTLVGTHTINSIHKYMYTPLSKKEREAEERQKSLVQLQNVDLRANRIINDSTFMVESERENCPLLVRDVRSSGEEKSAYGSSTGAIRKTRDPKRRSSKRRKPSPEPNMENDNSNKDWWSKYFASVETMIKNEKEAQKERQGLMQPQVQFMDERQPHHSQDEPQPSSSRGERPHASRGAPTANANNTNPTALSKNQIPTSALTKIYPHELEAVPEYNEFKEWLQTFELYRGKKTGEETEDDNRVVGAFKGAIKVYKWPLPRGIDDHTVMGFDPNYGFFQGVPNNDPIHVLVRVYIVKATDLHPMDMNGKADPYIVLSCGSKRVSDKENYVSKQLNPVFGKCFEIEATFPQDSILTIQVNDWDLLGADDVIGETKIDLENRFYSRHRATCGLPSKYEEQGYNRWRDAMKPTQILAKLCKEGKLETPVYDYGKVRIGRNTFSIPVDDQELFSDPNTTEEQMALIVLHRWQEVPKVGTHLVRDHVETRPLYNPNKPGVEQGRLEMWVDMFPMDMPLPGPPLDISARKPKSYELRVIIWNTDEVVLEDDAFFTGEKMSDIYVKGWVKGPDDCQSTDIHYRSLTGEGNFNWRFIYRFDYLEAEERIVISRKESLFSWDETECKIPARMELQVWDADHFSADDFLGAITLDLNRFPRGAKSSKLCTLEMLRIDVSVPMVNIFKQKRVKGWWPFYIKREGGEMELTGKVEAEIHLLTREEAEKVPAGPGRNEPDPLEKPNRPDASFMWFLNPLKSIRYILWHNHKFAILKWAFIICIALSIIIFFYAFPGYFVKKLLGT